MHGPGTILRAIRTVLGVASLWFLLTIAAGFALAGAISVWILSAGS